MPLSSTEMQHAEHVSLDAAALLVGPRGRHLCLAVAHRLHEPVRSAWLQAAWHPGDSARLDALRAALAHVDPSSVSDWDDPLSFAASLDESVSAAMGWQEPRDEDRVAADTALTGLLEPIAHAISHAPSAQWWATGIDLETLRCTSRYDHRSPAVAPVPGGMTARLADWRREEIQDDARARAERPDEPAAAYSGHWWSTPSSAGLSTTRALGPIGSVNLLWEEDSFGQWDAQVWHARPVRSPRVHEIDGPQAWIDLVARYPLDVSWSRRQDWYRVTGTDSTWLIPDWEAVSREFDAVHLTVLGYLATATRRLDVTPAAATLLAGWDPDQTWWLTDSLTITGTPLHWQTDQEADDVFNDWHVVSP